MRKAGWSLALLLASIPACSLRKSARLESNDLRLEAGASDATLLLVDKSTGVEWTMGPPQVLMKDQRTITVRPAGAVERAGEVIRFAAEPGLEFQIALRGKTIEYSFQSRSAEVAEVNLLNQAFPLEPGAENYYAVPHRMGILVPVEGEQPFNRRLAGYRGYSMAMFGAVKNGSALLATWEDPYTDVVLDYTVAPRKRLAISLAMRKTARMVRLQPLGRGGYTEIAKAYRPVAKQRGFLKTLAEKMKENPRVGEFFGAADFKPFAFGRIVPKTRWNKTDKEILRINFSAQECADLAEHYKKDLGIDKAMLVLNGWINGGYDNRHPDVLPAAPEIGGNAGLMACARRVKALGWIFGLHDNYQDMYRDAASFNEDDLIKDPDGSPRQGGVWWGGQAWLICSRRSMPLAQRPQNVPGIKKLFGPTLFFSDTVFAAPLYECSDPKHPTTLNDDIEQKQKLCDYLRREFGLFGSEEGREWGVAHADYFEGLMSHKTRFRRPDDTDIVIPLFEMVYGDAIPIYAHQSDRPRPDNPAYILDHILYAEMPVYYFGNHRYWTDRKQDFQPPAGAEAPLVFARGGRFGLIDQFIHNTYEVLSPLHRVTALMPMTGHQFLTADRKVERTRFGSDVEITVNYGPADYKTPRAVLPPYGFVIESPALIAFYARSYGGVTYKEPPLFVVKSLDGKPLSSSNRVRIYRGFGDHQIEWNGRVIEVDAEEVVSKKIVS